MVECNNCRYVVENSLSYYCIWQQDVESTFHWQQEVLVIQDDRFSIIDGPFELVSLMV